MRKWNIQHRKCFIFYLKFFPLSNEEDGIKYLEKVKQLHNSWEYSSSPVQPNFIRNFFGKFLFVGYKLLNHLKTEKLGKTMQFYSTFFCEKKSFVFFGRHCTCLKFFFRLNWKRYRKTRNIVSIISLTWTTKKWNLSVTYFETYFIVLRYWKMTFITKIQSLYSLIKLLLAYSFSDFLNFIKRLETGIHHYFIISLRFYRVELIICWNLQRILLECD